MGLIADVGKIGGQLIESLLGSSGTDQTEIETSEFFLGPVKWSYDSNLKKVYAYSDQDTSLTFTKNLDDNIVKTAIQPLDAHTSWDATYDYKDFKNGLTGICEDKINYGDSTLRRIIFAIKSSGAMSIDLEECTFERVDSKFKLVSNKELTWVDLSFLDDQGFSFDLKLDRNTEPGYIYECPYPLGCDSEGILTNIGLTLTMDSSVYEELTKSRRKLLIRKKL